MITSLKEVSSEDIEKIMEDHFDPKWGASYWTDYANRNGFGPKDIKSLEDFINIVTPTGEEAKRFEYALAHEPLEQFIPKWLMEEVQRGEEHIYGAETGGTTGPYPKRGFYSDEGWQIQLDLGNIDLGIVGIPKGINWIWAGPSGPHAIGRFALDLLRTRGGLVYPIDLDPRWIKETIASYGPDSEVFGKYMTHIAQQIGRLLEVEDIQAIFTTSVILQRLEQIANKVGFDLTKLKGILHGGTALMPPDHKVLREEVFPDIPFTGLYGSSITGADSFQKPLEDEDNFNVVYIPNSPISIMRIVDPNTKKDVSYGEEGQVVKYRLSSDFLVPGLFERDLATKVEPYGNFAELPGPWITNVHSAAYELKGTGEIQGVY